MARILLLQARNPDDPMLGHELGCFAARCGLDRDAFHTVNLTEEMPSVELLDDVEVVMVGGSGDYSLASGGFDWHEPYLELLRTVVTRDVPTFASCFGFQGLVQALGGTIRRDPARSEVGTFTMHLTEVGRTEPLLASCGHDFDAQLGHNDSADLPVPDPLEVLAYSDRCPVEAVRVSGGHVFATQFHPELTMDDNVVRYLRYIDAYRPTLSEDGAKDAAAEIHRPSPAASALLHRFVERYLP